MNDYTSRTIASADGLKLHLRDYYPAQDMETGLPVICLHGLTRNARDFELVAPRIASLGRRTLALDVRGRGLSDRDPDPEHYQPMIYAQDVLRIMDELKIARAVFVGTSMGGLISMVTAMLARPRVAAVILNDIGATVGGAGLDRIGQYVGKTMEVADWPAAIAATKTSQGPAFPDADDAFWNIFARRIARETPNGAVMFDYDPMIALTMPARAAGESVDASPLFASLADIPTLVVRGAISDLLAADTVAAMRASKPDLQTAEVPGVGHAPTLEEEAAWLPMIDFLARAA